MKHSNISEAESHLYWCELHDSLTLALDVSEKADGEYTQKEQELRRYLKAGLRYANAMLEGAV